MEDKNILLNHLDLEKLSRCPDDCSKSYDDLKDIKEALENNDNLKVFFLNICIIIATKMVVY